ncbi:hypothetical protein FGU65_12475 [Methanoculleus sp. FWC-SCC1]|uniref:Uncharacterized protein n=1 Tax=Methanoculleus frigidifontis TaxID=2584085 RepID=A0ABT8MCP0_9EURY|nr:hypothetical protein [Methanoculleus sp. FWC-SCC1]MDN7025688.1 hypothetical protein [Methanoculleus sp. FWC-SCC1]
MGVQYIYDTEGNRTGVIVPIDIWENLVAGRADTPVGIPDPARYRGIYKDLPVNLESETRDLRNEWNRI